MSDKEETKLCPYRPSVESDTYELQHKIIANTIGFAPCLQERCSMWINPLYCDGFCGLIGAAKMPPVVIAQGNDDWKCPFCGGKHK